MSHLIGRHAQHAQAGPRHQKLNDTAVPVEGREWNSVPNSCSNVGQEMDENLVKVFEKLYGGLDRCGPGDDVVSEGVLEELFATHRVFARRPLRVLDLGSGSGASALALARKLPAGSSLLAIDMLAFQCAAVEARAAEAGLSHVIEARQGDMVEVAQSEPAGSVDLIWSEGAIYNVGVQVALPAWRRILRGDGGSAVVFSDCVWFEEEQQASTRLSRAKQFFAKEYPGMRNERQTELLVQSLGFKVIDQVRLLNGAWTRNYYGAVERRLVELEPQRNSIPGLAEAMDEMVDEIRMFRDSNEPVPCYGYTLFVCVPTS